MTITTTAPAPETAAETAAATAADTAATPITPSPAIDLRWLSEADMIAAGVTDMAACVDTMSEMFRALSAGDFRMGGENNNSHGAMILFPDAPEHEGMPANADDRRFMAMPAYLGGSFRTAGVKWYGSNTDNRALGLPRSIHVFVLNDKDTGAPLAIMSGNLLSAYRTGAVPGVGARHFARADSKVVGLIGPGVMNRTSLEAFVVACPGLTTVKVKGRGRASLEAFVGFVHERFPQLDVQVVDTVEEAVRGSDIVSMATTGGTGSATYPRIETEWISPGTFLSLPSYVTFDDDFLAGGARTVVDSWGLYEAWAEETPFPHHEAIGIVGNRFTDLVEMGRLERSAVEELGDVVAGRTPGRTSDDEIVLLSVGGMPVEDVAWATTVYRTAVEHGIGTPLNLWERPALA